MLTLQFIPYSEIEHLDSDNRINKLMNLVKGQRIVLMQGRLKPDEETRLITETMNAISESFKGIEICTIYPEEKTKQMLQKLRKEFVKLLVGQREGLTIIGPASIVKEIKRDPNKIQLLAEVPKKTKKANSKRKK